MLWWPVALIGCTTEPSEGSLEGTTQLAREVRASFEPGEVVVSAPWPGAPEVGMSLLGWGADPVVPSRAGGRTTYVYDGLTEWWERGPKGLEQGFVVEEAPVVGPLVLELALKGAEAVVDADGRSATLLPEPGGRLRYEGLRAWDAEGTDLPAWMEATPGGLWLLVDTEGAVGAITVDPVLTAATWSAGRTQSNAYFGGSVASAGDVNGDGFGDVVVGARYHDDGQTDEGAAFVYLGSAAGLAAVPAWSAEGNQADASFGRSVASAGDVNGDGYGDVVVGAELYDNGQTDQGAAAVYLGSAAGLSAVPAWGAEGSRAEAWFGSSVASAGDVNGDGYGDVVVGAPLYRDGQIRVGAAYVYLGSAAGLAAAPAWTAEGNPSGTSFGTSVASAGDVNGDGYGDVIVGAMGYGNGQSLEGAAFVYLGSAAGLSAAPAVTLEGEQSGAALGTSVASAGDVNGDGYGDVVVGAPDYDNYGQLYREGAALVYLGSAAGLAPAPAATVPGARGQDNFGVAVASAGDVNGDGYGDVIVGATEHDDGQTDEGAALVYLGSAAGLSTTAVLTFEGDQTYARFGISVASAGDTDGDGHVDLMVGAERYDNGFDDEGEAFVYAGLMDDRDADANGDVFDLCPDVPDPAQLDADGDGVGNACDTPELAVVGVVSPGALVSLVATAGPGESVGFGGSVGSGGAGPCAAVLGGLCLDLGPGAVSLGTAVATGLGAAVSQVRVPAAVQANGTYVVQAAVRRGPGGVDSEKSIRVIVDGTRMDWDQDGLVDADEVALGTDPTLADTDGDGLEDGDESLLSFDPRVADTDGDGVLDGADRCWAGDDAFDLDGDGSIDACDTCPTDPDPGQMDADGDGLGDVCDGAVLSAASWTAEGDQVGAAFGGAVASAGDVNGDGYDDVVVGASQYADGQLGEGAAAVYLGSAAGLSATPSWTADSDQRFALFGASVASAGDVNGDGYGDVVVGAPAYDLGQTDEGAAFLYLGSAAGLSVASAWRAEGDDWGARLGVAVASAGDVNGDGYGDVIVGAESYSDYANQPDEGQARLYVGSAAGLAATPAWVAEGDQEYAFFGASVASAGDVDGDGYDDVVIGSPGTACLYSGSATGLSAVPAWRVVVNTDFNQGASVASAGDVNGDGYADVVVGDGTRDAAGSAFVYLGSAAGLSAAPVLTLEGNQAGSLFGTSVASAGDVNLDGFGDVVIGMDLYDDGQADEGVAVLYLGSARGLASAPAWLGQPDQPSAGYGRSVASAGDVDGDGRSDLLVGASAFDHGQGDEGRAWLYLGQTP